MFDTMKVRLRKWFNSTPKHVPAPGVRLRLEALEDRTTPATITVTDTGDAVALDGLVTLREAIASINAGMNVSEVVAVGAYGTNDTIRFNIPGMGIQRISLANALPAITKTVTIDATTQPTYGGEPVIHLDGNTNRIAGDALDIRSAGSVVKGLSITGFVSGAAVDLTNATGGTTVAACYLGVDPTSTAAANQYGVKIFNSAANTITGNVISGNYTGVWIQGAGAVLNTLTANYIGTDATGQLPRPNGNPADPTRTGDGVYIVTSASNNTIGGDYYTQANVISGNQRNVVEIDFQSNGNMVEGNRIGLAATGAALGNGGDGVHVLDASNDNIIGGGTFMVGSQPVDLGNIISSNTGNGVRIDHTQPYPGPSRTQILGNYIGLGPDGSTPRGNGQNGILITDSPNTLIGSGNATEGNTISANGANGISINSTTGTKIYGNHIGTDVNVQNEKPNQGDGIVIGNASQTQVGQSGANSRNIISGNVQYGVELRGADHTTIANNYIGLAADGYSPVGNHQGGVAVGADSTNNTIGGASYDLGNVISGNQGTPTVGGNGISLLSGSSYTTVAGNYIGTDAAGVMAVRNAVDGIYIQLNSTLNTIGLEGAYNLVSGNGNIGIEVDGNNNYIDFNYVGFNAALQPSLPNGNTWWVISPGNGFGPDNYHN
jgi:hypothetical protein